MDAQTNKDERIEIRVSSQEKKMFKQAQKLSGDKSFSNFIIQIVKKKSEEILAKRNQVLASERDRNLFFDTVFGESTLNQNLVEAAVRYKSKSGQQ